MTHSPDRLPKRLDVSSAGQPPHTATPCHLPQQVSAALSGTISGARSLLSGATGRRSQPLQAPMAGAFMDASACPGSRNVDG